MTMYVLKFADIKTGDILIPDAGFTCMSAGSEKTVLKDTDGSLYVTCEEGSHLLCGQISSHDPSLIVGFIKA